MNNHNTIIKSALTGVLALAAVSLNVNATTTATSSNQNTEKCYGIVKAGMNDCATGNSSCVGTSKKDKQADAYLLLPKGTCNKIVGGSLMAVTDGKAK